MLTTAKRITDACGLLAGRVVLVGDVFSTGDPAHKDQFRVTLEHGARPGSGRVSKSEQRFQLGPIHLVILLYE